MPPAIVIEFDRSGHVSRIAHRGPRIGPLCKSRNLSVTQRDVVLKLLNADSLVDVPRRHVPLSDLLLDGSGPRACILIREERHRPDTVRTVTVLASLLQNRGHVLRKRHLILTRFRRGLRSGELRKTKRS